MAEEKDSKAKTENSSPGGKKDSASMVAPHPLGTGNVKKADTLREVEAIANELGLKPWEIAGMMRAAGWRNGKQVTEREFKTALTAFRSRPQGGRKI